MSELSDRFFAEIEENRQYGASTRQLRYYFRWKKSLRNGANSIKDEMPWLTFKVIDFLKLNLNKKSEVFEFGGGGSTLFFAKRVKRITTVEHDKEWFGVLQENIKKRKLNNWIGHLVEPKQGNRVNNPDKANPDHYSSDDEKSKGFNFYDYARDIDSYENHSFDFILIDGRSRPSCLKHAIPKIKKGGYLILDNSNREYYLLFFKEQFSKEFKQIINDTGPCPYLYSFTTTSVWQKNN